MPSIFLSHSSRNNKFARKLASLLREREIEVWLDEAELQVGDSLIWKISAAIQNIDYLGVILSPQSVVSEWVKKEVEVAINQEISGKKINVLPILREKCDIPLFLKGKIYVDLSSAYKYKKNFPKLVKKITGWETSPYDEQFALDYFSKSNTEGKLTHLYVFGRINRGLSFSQVKREKSNFYVDCNVPDEVVGYKNARICGILTTEETAQILFSKSTNNLLYLSKTGKKILQLYKDWFLKNKKKFQFTNWFYEELK